MNPRPSRSPCNSVASVVSVCYAVNILVHMKSFSVVTVCQNSTNSCSFHILYSPPSTATCTCTSIQFHGLPLDGLPVRDALALFYSSLRKVSPRSVGVARLHSSNLETETGQDTALSKCHSATPLPASASVQNDTQRVPVHKHGEVCRAASQSQPR